jgi:PEGA domain-containing protein
VQARQLPDPFGEPPQVAPAPPAPGQVPQAPPDQRAIEMRGPSPDSRFGRLAIRVQPQGAEVYIDGERWLAPDTADRLVVNVAEGRHHVEVHKTGFDSFSIEVDVRRGETSPINVSLPARGQ